MTTRRGAPSAVVILVATLGGCAAPAADGEESVLAGRLEIVVVDDFDGTLLGQEYFLETGEGRRVELFFDRIAPPDPMPGVRVEVRGEELSDDQMDVWSLEVLSVSEQALTGAILTRKVAVLLINFADERTEPITTAQARQKVFGNSDSPNAFFQEASFGASRLVGVQRPDGDVFGWYTIQRDNQSCPYHDWARAARDQAAAQGIDLSQYHHVMHFFIPDSNCSWGALGALGGRYTYLKATDRSPSAKTLAHELGHNFSLGHARSYRCTSDGTNVSLSDSCSTSEYGDRFDVMGSTYSHFGAYGKGRIGWLAPENMRTVSTDGEFLVAPLETRSSGIQSLRIQRDESTFYYFEYRRALGFDAPLTEGVLARIGPDYSQYGKTLLLDMTPETNTFTDAPLTAGQFFLTPDSELLVEVVSASSSGARVRVDFDPAIDSRPPTVPSGLTVTETRNNSASLAWSASNDASGVSHYVLYRAQGDGAFAAVATVDGTTYTDAGLSYNQSYRYYVTAVDHWNNESAASTTVTARTKTFCLFFCL